MSKALAAVRLVCLIRLMFAFDGDLRYLCIVNSENSQHLDVVADTDLEWHCLANLITINQRKHS